VAEPSGVRRFRVVLSRRAAAQLDALGSRPRGMLILALGAIAARRPRDGLVNVWRADQIAACEVIAGERVVLVYAIQSATALRTVLFGEHLHREFRHLQMRRAIHG
jgi:hypothetical protein